MQYYNERSERICIVRTIKNEDIEGIFFVDAENTLDYQSTSMTVVVSLEVGDVLFVRTSSTYTPHGNVISKHLSVINRWLAHSIKFLIENLVNLQIRTNLKSISCFSECFLLADLFRYSYEGECIQQCIMKNERS